MTPTALMALALLVTTRTALAAPDPAQAGAGVDEEAEELAFQRFLEGEAHYAAGRYEQAVTSFREAWEMSGHPELLYNLANAYERIPDYASAIEALRAYLDTGEVHDVVSVQERLRRLELTLQSSQPAAPAPPPPAAEAPAAKRPGWPVWALGSTAVAATASAVTFGVLARADHREALTSCQSTAAGLLCDVQGERYVDREASRALISDVSTGVAVATAIGAVVAYATGSGARPVALLPRVGRAPGLELQVTGLGARARPPM